MTYRIRLNDGIDEELAKKGKGWQKKGAYPRASSTTTALLLAEDRLAVSGRARRGAEVTAFGPFMQFRGCSKCAFAPSFSPEKLQIRELRL